MLDWTSTSMDFLHTELVFAKNAQKNYYSRLFFIKRRRSCVRKISRIWTADANSSFFKWTWNNSTQSSQIILLRSQQITIYQKKYSYIFYFHHFICRSLLLGIRGGYKNGKTKKLNHIQTDGFSSASIISYLTKSLSHTFPPNFKSP